MVGAVDCSQKRLNVDKWQCGQSFTRLPHSVELMLINGRDIAVDRDVKECRRLQQRNE